MATASDNPDVSIRIMEEGLTCYICYNFLREPKDLDCPHVYCLQCLQEWTKKKRNVECPECRHITAVPKGGLVNLRTNLRLQNMIENYVESKQIAQKSVPMCPTHKGEQQHFFCITCGIPVCHNCLILDHPRPQHEIKDLQVIVQSLKEKMASIRKEMKNIKKQQQELGEMERKLMEHHASLVDQMDKLYPIKRSAGALTTYGPRINQAEEMPSLDTLQINPVSSQQDVGANSNRTCKLTLLSGIGPFEWANSIASTRTDQLAVVDKYKNDGVSIYRKDNVGSIVYKHQYCLGSSQSNGNIESPLAVAVTLEGKFLVTDNEVVKVFSPAGRYEKSWSESIVATRITTTPDDLIVISSSNQRVITVHQSNGELIRTHQVDCRVVKGIASNGKQIAFTTFIFSTFREGKVCVIYLVTGQTLWTIDMRQPLGIFYEPKLNSLLVASSKRGAGQSVIEQYCSTTGRLLSCLASDLNCPMGMTVTQDGKLAVADEKTVKIYQIDFE